MEIEANRVSVGNKHDFSLCIGFGGRFGGADPATAGRRR